MVFENLLAKQSFQQSSFLPFVMTEIMLGRHICLTQSFILSFTSDFSSFKVKKDVKLAF